MWERSHSIVVPNLRADQIWNLFADINRWQEWDDSIDHASLQGEFAVGNSFELKPKGGPKVQIELIVVEAPFRFVDKTHFPLAVMTGEHQFEETPEGLRMTTTMRVSGFLSWLWIKLVAQGIVDSLPTEMVHQAEMARERS